MANEKHDPWALLREARGHVFNWPDYTVNQKRSLLDRIDAALAAHEAVPPSDVKVEWETDAFGNDYRRHGNVLSMVAQTLDGNWGWETRVDGYADTEAEAKSAAIAAARRLR